MSITTGSVIWAVQLNFWIKEGRSYGRNWQTSKFERDFKLENLQRVNFDLACDLDNVEKFLAQGCFRDTKDPLSETDAQFYRRYAENLKWEKLVHRVRGFLHEICDGDIALHTQMVPSDLLVPS